MSQGCILRGPELHIPIPERSLGRLLYENMLHNLDQEAFIDETTDEKLSYKDVLDITCRLASSLKNLGYANNDLLSVCSENSIYFFCPLIAALYLGMTTAPISNYYAEDEIQHSIDIAQPRIIFCSESTIGKFVALKQKNKCIERLIVMGVETAVPGSETLTKFINENCDGSIDVREFSPVDVNTVDQTALIMFSSGTTGLPKGVMITHNNCLMRIVHIYDPRLKYHTTDNAMNLGYLPFYHASGLTTTLGTIISANTTIVLPRFAEKLFLNCIQKYKISFLPVVPTILVLLAKSPTVDEYDLSTLKDILVGGAAVSEALEKEVKARLKLDSIRQVYGMTETTLAVLTVNGGVERQGSSGTVTPGMACMVRDPESGAILGANQIGELCFKGGMVMKGYYKNPEATTRAFTRDGWLKTGDLGYYDNDGFFYIVDRLKDLIKYKSFQVPPAEIEALLLKNPKIKEAAVVGLPDERAGELPLAFIVKQANVELTEDEVLKYVADRLSVHKHLHGGVRFMDELPKNMSGKILKTQLKRMRGEIKSKL